MSVTRTRRTFPGCSCPGRRILPSGKSRALFVASRRPSPPSKAPTEDGGGRLLGFMVSAALNVLLPLGLGLANKKKRNQDNASSGISSEFTPSLAQKLDREKKLRRKRKSTRVFLPRLIIVTPLTAAAIVAGCGCVVWSQPASTCEIARPRCTLLSYLPRGPQWLCFRLPPTVAPPPPLPRS